MAGAWKQLGVDWTDPGSSSCDSPGCRTSNKSLQVPEIAFSYLESGRTVRILPGCCEDLMSLSVFSFGYRPGPHSPFLGVCCSSWPSAARPYSLSSFRQPIGGLVLPPAHARISASVGLTGGPSWPYWSPAMDMYAQELLVGACWPQSLVHFLLPHRVI